MSGSKEYHFKIGPADFENAQISAAQDRIDPLTPETLFSNLLFCSLSRGERDSKQRRVFQKFVDFGLTAPLEIIDRMPDVYTAIAPKRWPTASADMVFNLAVWWQYQTDIAQRIITDIEQNNRQNEFELRNELANSPNTGVAFKCASLFLGNCGYEHVAPIDIHIQRFVTGFIRDYPELELNVPPYKTDYKKSGGFWYKPYFAWETVFQAIASHFQVTPYVLHRAVWTKASTWTAPAPQLEFDQLANLPRVLPTSHD
ncbi:hypothetical protein HY389_01755 [Candidatus Daviesbacteria bacterium]|nr:hypothetical protein [Candidatus Daviesbacteria bacterium]